MLGCPKCKNGRTSVIDSRDSGTTIRRRRKCPKCEHRYTTYEVVEGEIALREKQKAVIKEYRKIYPDDKKSDEDLLNDIKSIEDNYDFKTLTYWVVNALGILKG